MFLLEWKQANTSSFIVLLGFKYSSSADAPFKYSFFLDNTIVARPRHILGGHLSILYTGGQFERSQIYLKVPKKLCRPKRVNENYLIRLRGLTKYSFRRKMCHFGSNLMPIIPPISEKMLPMSPQKIDENYIYIPAMQGNFFTTQKNHQTTFADLLLFLAIFATIS